MSDNTINTTRINMLTSRIGTISLLLSSPCLYGAARSSVKPMGSRPITPQAYIFQEEPGLNQARDKFDAVHLTLDKRTATRGTYFFEIRYDEDFLCPQFFASEFIHGRQHVFISYHLGMAHEFKSISIYKDDLAGEYLMVIFARDRPMETNL